MALSGSFGKVIWAQGPGASTADDGFPAGDLTEIARPADTQAPAPPARAQRYAHAGQEIEVGYADAVLAFNNKNFRKALEHLDRLLAISPQHVPSLELQALTLRSQGDDPRSLTTYRRLIQLKPEAERGPYYFEAAMIFYKNKRYAEARPLFERAITTKFNVGASHFFLGNIAFQSDAWARAERHFAAVLRDAPEDLRLASHYYVGILQAKRGYGVGSTDQLLTAREIATRLKDHEIARQVGTAASAALAPYSKPQWFGSVSVLGQYDGNVSLASDALSQADVGAADQATGKTQLVAGFGRMSPALADWQWVASYRAAYNRNFNREVADFEFFSNVPAIYLTRRPLARTHYGLKAEGNYTFRNTSGTFRPFNASLETGPYFRTSPIERLQVGIEAFVRPQTFQQEESGGADRRSGMPIVGRLSARLDGTSRWLAPMLTLTYENTGAQGDNFKGYAVGAEFSNNVRISPVTEISLSGATTVTNYTLSSPRRLDRTYFARVGWVRNFSPRLALIADASYNLNSSTVDSFDFKRPIVGMGLSYNL